MVFNITLLFTGRRFSKSNQKIKNREKDRVVNMKIKWFPDVTRDKREKG